MKALYALIVVIFTIQACYTNINTGILLFPDSQRDFLQKTGSINFTDVEDMCTALSTLQVSSLNLVRVKEDQRGFTAYSLQNKAQMENIQKSLAANKMDTKSFVANYFNTDSLIECLASKNMTVNYDFKLKALKPSQFFEKMNQDIQSSDMSAWIYVRMDERKMASKNRRLAQDNKKPDETLQAVYAGPNTVSGILVMLFLYVFIYGWMMAVDGLSGPAEFPKHLLKYGKEM